MKKKIMSALLMSSLVIGGGVVGASVYHIVDASEALKVEYKEQVDNYYSEKDFKIKNDTQHLTTEEIERMTQETQEYLNQKLNTDYLNSLNNKSQEIVDATDEKIQEIKEYIDSLIK